MFEGFSALAQSQTAQNALHILTSLILSGAVGWEREARARTAGLRTHMMVGVGACLFTLLTIVLVDRFENEDAIRADPIRIIGAVTSGVAFLAAGAIIQSQGTVRGLTTGASLWVAGAIGLACGLGEYALAVLAVAVTLLVLFCVRALETRLFAHRRAERRRRRDQAG